MATNKAIGKRGSMPEDAKATAAGGLSGLKKAPGGPRPPGMPAMGAAVDSELAAKLAKRQAAKVRLPSSNA